MADGQHQHQITVFEAVEAEREETLMNQAGAEATALVRASREIGLDGDLDVFAIHVPYAKIRVEIQGRQLVAMGSQASLWRSFFGQAC
jgi:hypothetical protein